MHEFEEHPYLLLGATVAVLIVIGGIVIFAHTATPSGSFRSWSDPTAIVPDAQSGAELSTAPSVPSAIGSSTTAPFIPLSAPTSEAPASFDMAAFLAQLSTPAPTAAKPAATKNDSSALTDAYAFIPSGIVSTTSLSYSVQRTPQEQALYDYGNEAGSYIQTYDDTHRDAPTVLKAQIEDRQSDSKGQAVRDIGAALIQVGRSLEGIESVPAVAEAPNLALAKAYQDIGAKLQKVPDAQRDSDLVTAIESYDAAVDSFNRKYISIVMLFSGLGVKFGAGDPGSVFTFSQGAGL